MNTKPTNAIALYTVFSDEFVQRESKNYKYSLNMLLKRDIVIALIRLGYKQYFNTDISPDDLNIHNYGKLKEYGGLCFTHTFGDNWAMAAIGNSPLTIGKMTRPLDDHWKPNNDYLHVNEYKQYEQSGYDTETLYYVWCKKNAYRKLHNIESPTGSPFDSDYFKEFDSTAGEYSLLRFDLDKYVQYIAVTGNTEFVEVPIEDISTLN